MITTADEIQRDAYQSQIDAKKEKKELPINLEIYIVSDPPGPKLGNGGSTFTVLSFLKKIFGEKMFELKVLIIHAGGLSKRLPSTSILGKIFSILPFGSPCYQMLDVKLALYWPFVPKMKPGVFLTCADDIIIYNLGKESDWSLEGDGFIALAHPSSLQVGKGHGVFVLEDKNALTTDDVQQHRCQTVLQKPSVEMMHKYNAIVDDKNEKSDKTFVFTDSAFLFTSDISKRLLEFFEKHGPFQCEIDAYGDFLQALGSQPPSDYIQNLSNITTVSSNLVTTRKKIFDFLKDSSLSIVVLSSSHFIHIGSIKEVLYHFCNHSLFTRSLSLCKDSFNFWSNEMPDEKPIKKLKIDKENCGCVMHSVLPDESHISKMVVLEFCHFNQPLHVLENSLLSNCEFLNFPPGKNVIKIPENIFLHTVPVILDKTIKYVTLAFHIEDDIKKTVEEEKLESLLFFQKNFKEISASFDISVSCFFSAVTSETFSLWNAQLFPIANSMSESFELTLNLITAIKEGKRFDFNPHLLMSMQTILEKRSVSQMLEFRNELWKKIHS